MHEELKLLVDSIERIETDKYVGFRTSNILGIIDSIYDVKNKQYIFSCRISPKEKSIDTMYMYNTIYLFMDSKFNIIGVKQEIRGFNPTFIINEDNEIYVELNHIQKNRLIILPLRNENIELKTFKDLGREYFTFANKPYGHFKNQFNDKDDEIVSVVINAKGECTSLKKIRLEFMEQMNNCKIYIKENKLYIYRCISNGTKIQYIVYIVDEKFKIIDRWISEEISNERYYIALYDVEEGEYKFFYQSKETSTINNIVFDMDGKIISDDVIFEYDKKYRWFGFRPGYELINDGVLIRSNTSENNHYLMVIRNNRIEDMVFSNEVEDKIYINGTMVSNEVTDVNYIKHADKFIVYLVGIDSPSGNETGFRVYK